MPLLDVQHVSKEFKHRPALRNLLGRERSGTTMALKEVSLTADHDEVVAILGPNGSGKTTLFKIIAGMLLPDHGKVLLHVPQSNVHQGISIAVASERSFYPRLTARENLDYFATLENIPKRDRHDRAEKVLEIVGLTSEAELLVQKFSSGMYQRLAIARALLRTPALLLLDEPTRSLDPEAAESLWQWIRESASKHATVLLATHNFLEAAAVAHRALILDHGHVADQLNVTSADDLRDRYFSATRQPRAAAVGSAC